MTMVRGVKLMSSGVGVLALGAGFGAVTSLVNDVSSPYGVIGTRLVKAGWAWVAAILSIGVIVTRFLAPKQHQGLETSARESRAGKSCADQESG
jgi:hypothetical protein